MFGGQARRGKRPSQCSTRECRAAPPPDMVDLTDGKTTRVPGHSAGRSARPAMAAHPGGRAFRGPGLAIYLYYCLRGHSIGAPAPGSPMCSSVRLGRQVSWFSWTLLLCCGRGRAHQAARGPLTRSRSGIAPAALAYCVSFSAGPFFTKVTPLLLRALRRQGLRLRPTPDFVPSGPGLSVRRPTELM